MRDRFGHRHHAMGAERDIAELSTRIRASLQDGEAAVRKLADGVHPADLADAMRSLTDEEDAHLFRHLSIHEQAEVLDEVDGPTLKRLVALIDHSRLSQVLAELPPDEAADVLGALPAEQWPQVLALMGQPEALLELMAFPPETAGGLMSRNHVEVLAAGTQAEAIERIREQQDAEFLFSLFAIDAHRKLVGKIDLPVLLRLQPNEVLVSHLDKHVVTVQPEMDQEQVAQVFARYDLLALPVVDAERRLLGVVTADDIIDVVMEEADEDVAAMTGTDAHELERKSPVTIALMRMPWIVATMLIELVAGFVIKAFDQTLAQILLLASFMPIISAISGNTGLQSAAIIIRGLSSGVVTVKDWRHAVRRQLATTVILGGVCGILLGMVGMIWYGKWTFGALVAVGMFASVNIAGAVGTAIPLLSKKLGFDPALTAGPFETAFQDVVGISIFLGMATALLPLLK